MSSNKKLLLTGAHGLFARALIPDLSKDHELVLSDIVEQPVDGGFDYRRADIARFDQARAAVEGVDTLIHLAIASKRHIHVSHEEMNNLIVEVNVKGTHNIFEAARQAHVRKIVFLSSLTVYLGSRNLPRYDGTTTPEPLNFYACTKLFGENLARIAWRDHGIETITLRFGQPYPCHGGELDDKWRTSRRARSTYVAMEDVAHAVRCAVETDIEHGVYNIVSASDNQRFDLAPARAIGYRPTAYFSEEGLTFHPEGLSTRCKRTPITHD